ncbi:MAG: hypothetical protein VW378_04900 [bacterium]
MTIGLPAILTAVSAPPTALFPAVADTLAAVVPSVFGTLSTVAAKPVLSAAFCPR